MTALAPIRTSPFTSCNPLTVLPCWIDRLPDELISLILVTTFTLGSQLAKNPDFDNYIRFPGLVQHVSRRWKTVALSSPALWTIVPIRNYKKKAILPHPQRSGALALEVYVELRSSIPGISATPLDTTVDLTIGNHSRRIRKLHIHAPTTREAVSVVLGLPANLPNLIDFTLCATSCDPGTQNQLTLTAPRLQSLRLTHFSLDWLGLALSSNLETLSVEEGRLAVLHFDVLLGALQACPQLRELKLREQILDANDSTYPPLQPIVLGCLEVLSLRRFNRSELTTLIHLIRTPRLKVLFVGGPDVVDELGRPFEFQVPLLESLVVGGIGLCWDISRHLPHLRHLGLMYTPAQDELEETQREFRRLTSLWTTLPNPLPLESLTTNGVSTTELLAFFDTQGGRARLPLLRKLSVYSDDFTRTDQLSDTEALDRNEERGRLEALAELEVYSPGEDDDYDEFNAWENQELWKNTKNTDVADVQ